MRKTNFWTRTIAMLMVVILVSVSFSETAFAAFSSDAEEAAALEALEDLKTTRSIEGSVAKDILVQLGLLSDDGKPITENIIMDQTPYTLNEIKAYLKNGSFDAEKPVVVDGTNLTLGDLHRMIQIEEEIKAFQELYFPEATVDGYTPEIEASLSSMIMQLGESGINIKQKDTKREINRNLTIYVEETTVDYTATKIEFTVNLSEVAPYPVYVDYKTMDGSAVHGVDYEKKKGQLKIEAGESEKTIEIPLTNTVDERDPDTWWSGNRVFFVELSNPLGGWFEENKAILSGQLNIKGNLLDRVPINIELETVREYTVSGYYEDSILNVGRYVAPFPKEWFRSGGYISILAPDAPPLLDSHEFRGYNTIQIGIVEKKDGEYFLVEKGHPVFGAVEPIELRTFLHTSISSFESYQQVYFPELIPEDWISVSQTLDKDMKETIEHMNDLLEEENDDSFFLGLVMDLIASVPHTQITVVEGDDEPSMDYDPSPRFVFEIDPDAVYYPDSKVLFYLEAGRNKNRVFFNGPLELELTKPDGTTITIRSIDGQKYDNKFYFLEDVNTFLKIVENEDSSYVFHLATGEMERAYPISFANIFNGYYFRTADDPLFCFPELFSLDYLEITKEYPTTEQDTILDVSVDKASYTPQKAEDLEVQVTVTYDMEDNRDDWIWADYSSDFNKTEKIIDRLKVSIDGGATLYPLSPTIYNGDPVVDGKLYATIPLPFNTTQTEKEYKVELFYMPLEGTTGVNGDYTCLLGEEKMDTFFVSSVILIKESDLTITNMPELNKVYTIQEEVTQLLCEVSTINPTFPGIEWTSSDENIAIINRSTGVIYPKAEGEVQFTATAYNRKAGPAASVTSEVITVVNDGPPSVVIPKGLDVIQTKKNAETTIHWMTNLNNRQEEIGKDQEYTIDIYEGSYLTGTLPEEVYLTYTATETSAYIVAENTLNTVSKNGVPSYTFVVSAPHPEKDERISARGVILVAPLPAGVRLLTPLSQYVVDTADSYTASWILSGTEDEYDFEFSVSRNGVVVAAEMSENSATFPIAKVSKENLKDSYTVIVKVRNTPEDKWQTDSYIIQVYNKDAFTFEVDGQRMENGPIVLDNALQVDVLRSYNGNWSEADSAQIVSMQRDIPLIKTLTIADNKVWNSAADRFAWTYSGLSAFSLYRNSNAGLMDVNHLSSNILAPDTSFMLMGKTDGSGEISAIHARTNEEIKADVTVSTLKDKLYLFQFTPMRETTVSYIAADGEEITLQSDAKGQLAIYEPSGIRSSIQLSSGSGADLYVGTIYPEKLLSSEGDKSKSELYPMNYFSLKEPARVPIYLKDENGNPYQGEISYTGGLYKNELYCPDVQLGNKTNRLKTTLGANGFLELLFDVTKFYSLNEDRDVEVKPDDSLRFVLDIRPEGDGYMPSILNVNGNISEDISSRFGDSVVNLQKKKAGNDVSYISAQYADYSQNGSRMLDVLRNHDQIGYSDMFPSIELHTEVLCIGEEHITDYQAVIQDTTGKKATRQTYQLIQYPFTEVIIAKNITTFNVEEGIEQGKTKSYEVAVYKEGNLKNTLSIPFSIVNMVGMPQVTQEGKFQSITLDVNLNQGFTAGAVNSLGDMLKKGLQSFKTGVNTPFFRLTVTPTGNPMVYRGFAGIDLDLLGMSSDVVMNPEIEDKTYANAAGIKAALLGTGDTLGQRFDNKINSVMAKPGDTDIGGRLAGYLAGDIVWNPVTKSWDFEIDERGYTFGAKLGYHWTFNTVLGLVPLTAEFALGGAVEVDGRFLNRYDAMTDIEKLEVLTTIRVNAYVRAFFGLGFDYAVVAAKIGVFGQLNLTHYTQILESTTRDKGWMNATNSQTGHNTKIDGMVGIEVIVKFFFISKRYVLASDNFMSMEFESGQWNQIQEWIAGAGISDWGADILVPSSKIQTVFAMTEEEDRAYLTRNRSSSLQLLGETSDIIYDNTYPYRYPEITKDGALVVSLSDQGSEDLNQTRIKFGVPGQIEEHNIPIAWEGKDTADSNVSLDGTGDFAVAAWEKQKDVLEGEQYLNNETSRLMAMFQNSEIAVSVYDGDTWTSTRLTDNSTADVAPQVAVNAGKATVVWRSVAGSNIENPMIFDVSDELWYSSYENGNWTEPELLHREINGTITSFALFMNSAGDVGVTFSVSRSDMVGNEAYQTISDVFFMGMQENGAITAPIRLTLGDGTNENVKITAAEVRGKLQFIVAWYQSWFDETLQSTMGDVRFKVLHANGEVENHFPDSLSEMNSSKNNIINNRFEFIKTKDEKLSGQGIAWSSLFLDIKVSEDDPKTEKEVIYVSQFTEYEDTVLLTPGGIVADAGNYTTIDSFKVYRNGTSLNSIFLDTYYEVTADSFLTTYEGEDIYVPQKTSRLKKGNGTLTNEIEVSYVYFEREALKREGVLPLEFRFMNQGIEAVRQVVIKAGEEEIAVKDVTLLPNASQTVYASYIVPGDKKIENIQYTLTAIYESGKAVSSEGIIVLNTPDAGITENQVMVETLQNGERQFQLKFYNDSEIALVGNDDYTVKVAFSKNADVNIPIDVKLLSLQGDEVKKNLGTGVYQLDQTQLELLDNDSLTMNFSYTLSSEDPLPMNIYAKIYIEGKDKKKILDANFLNDAKTITLSDPVARNNGNPFKVTTEMENENGATIVQLNVENLSREPKKNVNVVVNLFDRNNHLLETKYLAVTAEALLQLRPESAETASIPFSTEGSRVQSYIIQQDPESADVSLQTLLLSDVVLDGEPKIEGYAYTATSVNKESAVVTAIPNRMGAAVTINGEKTQNGSCTIVVEPGDNEITVEIASDEEGMAPGIYKILLTNKIETPITVYLEELSGSDRNTWAKDRLQFAICLPDNAEEGNITGFTYSSDAGENWSAFQEWEKGEKNLFEITKEGIYENSIRIRLYKSNGSYEETDLISAKLDTTAPEMGGIGYEKQEKAVRSLSVFSEDGNWNGQLKITIPVEDALSGVKSVAAVQEGTGVEYTVKEEASGIYSFVVEEVYRGNILLTAEDMAGNKTMQSIRVNVDDKVPVGKLFEVLLSETKLTSQAIEVKIKVIHSDMDETTIEYALGAPENWMPYQGVITIEENVKLYYRAKDTSGNTTAPQLETISNIDKSVPVVQVVSAEDLTIWNTKEVLVRFGNIGNTIGKTSFYYREKNQKADWVLLDSGEVLFTQDGEYTYEVKAISETGLESEVAAFTVKIDREKPTGILQLGLNKWTGLQGEDAESVEYIYQPDLILTTDEDISGVSRISYAVLQERILTEDEIASNLGIVWKNYIHRTELDLPNNETVVIYVRLIDGAGNTSYLSSGDVTYRKGTTTGNTIIDTIIEDVVVKSVIGAITGDTAPLLVWLSVLTASGTGIVLIIKRKKKKKPKIAKCSE